MNRQQKSQHEKETAIIRRWAESPFLFVTECIGATPSDQQADALEWVRKIAFAKLKYNTGGYCTEEEKKTAQKLGISIRSGRGCHAKGTEILMYDGSIKKVEDVLVGDLLMGDDSEQRKVWGLARGREMIYRIRYSNGTYYDVNESHILSLRCTGYHAKKYRKGAIRNITVKDYLKLNEKEKTLWKGYKVPVEFPRRDLPIPPYILGIWLGDGCFSKPELTTIDKELIGAWEDYGNSIGLALSSQSYKSHRIVGGRGRTYRNAWMELLKKLNLFRNKHIPNDYITASRQQRLELLAGIIDTDGHLDQRKGRTYTIIQRDRHLVEQIQFLARSLGMNASLTTKNKSWTHKGIKNTGEYHEVHIGRNIDDLPVRISRKKPKKCKGDNRLELVFKFDVIKLEEDDYYGFSLDGNGLFLLGDFTVTHNTGKDAWLSWVYLWLLACWPDPQGLVTAPTSHQLRDVLWKEISKWMKQNEWLSSFLVWQTERVFNKENPEGWFITARTANIKGSPEEQAVTLSGMHDEYMIIGFDEASGIPYGTFSGLEATLTQQMNFCIMISQGSRSSGYFFDTHNSDYDRWICLQWNSEQSSNVVAGFCEGMLRKHGYDSNMYRINVRGEFPVASGDSFIPYEWVINAVDRELEYTDEMPVIRAFDVGGGKDPTIMVERCGPVITKVEEFNSPKMSEARDWIMRQLNDDEYTRAYIDNIGIGANVYSEIVDVYKFKRVETCDVREASDDATCFRLRDDLWQRVKTKFESGTIAIPNDKELIEQLTTVKFESDDATKGLIKIESKKKLRERGFDSPNRADALIMTYKDDSEVYKNVHKQRWAKKKAPVNLNWKVV